MRLPEVKAAAVIPTTCAVRMAAVGLSTEIGILSMIDKIAVVELDEWYLMGGGQ